MFLFKQHAINSLLDEYYFKKTISYCIATCHFTSKQYLKIKSPIVDINNYLNQILPTFDSLNRELYSSFCLVDTFPNYFSFNLANCKDFNTRITYQNKLENIYKALSNNHNTVLIISDISIKNNITILVLHI